MSQKLRLNWEEIYRHDYVTEYIVAPKKYRPIKGYVLLGELINKLRVMARFYINRKKTGKQLEMDRRKQKIREAMRITEMREAFSQLSPIDSRKIMTRASREVKKQNLDFGVYNYIGQLGAICSLSYKYTQELLKTVAV